MIRFDRVQQSRIHVALVDALGVSPTSSKSAEQRALEEYAYAASKSPEALAEACELASALRKHAGRGSFCFKLKDLAIACDSLDQAESAGRLLGAVHIGQGIWSIAPDQNVRRVEIPEQMFRHYLEEWACHLPHYN